MYGIISVACRLGEEASSDTMTLIEDGTGLASIATQRKSLIKRNVYGQIKKMTQGRQKAARNCRTNQKIQGSL